MNIFVKSFLYNLEKDARIPNMNEIYKTLGYTPVYHGTSSGLVSSIKREGISPKYMGTGADKTLPNYQRKGNIYVGTDKGYPSLYAELITRRRNLRTFVYGKGMVTPKQEKPVVLKSLLPKKEFSKFVPDEVSSLATDFRGPGISPKRIGGKGIYHALVESPKNKSTLKNVFNLFKKIK